MPSDSMPRVVLVLIFGFQGFFSTIQAKPPETTSIVAEDNNAFALDLYAKLKSKEGNLFFSPLSISTALAMTYAGARGQTAEEMAKTLHFTVENARLHPEFSRLIEGMNAGGQKGGYQLSVANALWGQKGSPPLPEFLKLAESNYAAGFYEVDFEATTEKTRQTINRWVEQKTQDKIKDLIQPGILNKLTRLVLVNAIYFKGEWENPFRKEDTQLIEFSLAADRKVKIPMMNKRAHLEYLYGGDFQILALRYTGARLSMVILLPKKVDGLDHLEKLLNAKMLSELLGKLHAEDVVLTLPKLTMTSQFELSETLRGMGMPLAFSDGADFSGINGRKGKNGLRLSAVIHKAFTNVDEKGTEAAASTAVIMAPTAAPPFDPAPPKPPIVFKADHPFVFLIWDNHSGSMLFLGRVMNPAE